MRSKRDVVVRGRFVKKFLSSYIIALLILSYLIIMMQVAKAEPNDHIITYDGMDPDTPQNTFDNGSYVCVNISVDGKINDPGSPYMLRTIAGTSGQEIWFPVWDNDTNPPWGSRNNPGDGMYWGGFYIGGNATDNSSMPRYLHLDNEETANISEIPGGDFDGDGEIEYHIITANYSEGPNNPPNTPNNENPLSGSTDRPITVSVSWDGGDPDGGDTVNYSVYFGNAASPPLVSENQSGLTYDPPGDLAEGTRYNWTIVAWDNHGAPTQGPLWWFETESGGGSPPFMNTTVMGHVNDSEGGNLTGVYVNATNQTYGLVNSTTTDGSGNYMFVISEGEYNISFERDGYITGYFEGIFSENSSHTVNKTLEQSGGGGGGDSNISGYVLTQNNDSIADATVNIDKQGGGYSNSAQTDAGGYYSFTNLEAGTYDLCAQKDGVFQQDCSNSNIVLGSSEVKQNVNFTVEVQGMDVLTCKGYVYQENTDGVPVEGANVTIETNGDEDDILGYGISNQLGYFEFTFQANQTAYFQGNQEVRIRVSAEGYHPYHEGQGEQHGLMSPMWEQEIQLHLEKIYGIDSYAEGYVYIKDTSIAIANATIMTFDDSIYFENQTFSNVTGYFKIGLNVSTSSSEYEFMITQNGYFRNETDIITINKGDTELLGIIYLEEKPDENSYVEGYVNDSEGQPVQYIELILFDPQHPFETEKADNPRTNATGYYNISTYPGNFSLVTLAKVIGESKFEWLAIGGYENEVIDVTVGENETITQNITLNDCNPDDIQVDITFSQWNTTIVNMSRTIIGNVKILRLMTDTDKNGIISASEASTLIDDINTSLTDSGGMFDIGMFFSQIPKDRSYGFFRLDSTGFALQSTNVEFSGLEGSSSSSEPLTVYMNNTIMVASGEVNVSLSRHSLELYTFYANPAFDTSYTLHFPAGNNVTNARQELVNITGINSSTVTVVPNQDPDWNDSEFCETVSMLVGTADAFASFDETYDYSDAIDADSDGKYDFLMKKVKFNTDTVGTFKLSSSLRSNSGVSIDQWTGESKSYAAGGNIVQFSFMGEDIYRKGIDGPYTVVVDLYSVENDTEIWFDSMSQTVSGYDHSDFDAPRIFFTGTISDHGNDSDDDGLYDYLVLCVQVNVGETGDYRFEANFDICSEQHGSGEDNWIGRVEKTKSFFETGIQWYNLSLDGSLIYAKGQNASIWTHAEIRPRDGGWEQLDNIDHMTEKYYFDQFVSPPPENSSVSGNITDVFGNPVEAQIRLENIVKCSENNTETNAEGFYLINATAGTYRLDVWCNSASYDYCNEVIILGTNESATRNIRLKPQWGPDRSDICWELEGQQFAEGQLINLNISTDNCGMSSNPMPNSNTTLEIYKQYEYESEYWGDIYINSTSNITDSNGGIWYVTNTSGFDSGRYNFRIDIRNSTLSPQVAAGDVWDIQISSLSLQYDLNKNMYRPGATGSFTYNLTYINNGTCVENALFTWKIKYWDWTEHILASDTFTSASGHGSRTFTVPSTVQNGMWYQMDLVATTSSGEVSSWGDFGVTSGSVIDGIEDSGVGTPGNYDALLLNTTVDIVQSGTYMIRGHLEDQNHNFVAYNETQQYCPAGYHDVIPLYFDGEEIQSSGKDGPYTARVELQKDSGGWWQFLDELENTTAAYSSTDFATPVIQFNTTRGITSYKNGTTGNYNALFVNFSVNASVNGNYSVHGELYKQDGESWYQIAWACSDVEIDGSNLNTDVNMTLSFAGSEISASEQTSPYKVHLNLHYGTCDWHGEHITHYGPDTEISADYTEFCRPSAFVEDIIDYGPNVDEDLVIGVLVNITQADYQGNYSVHGMLHSSDDEHRFITDVWNQSNLGSGVSIVNLTFSGDQIYSKGKNGPYKLDTDLKNFDTGEWLGWREFDTSAHSYTDFSTPSAMFIGTHSDQGIDEDGDGFYDYIRVTLPLNITQDGNYEVCGEIFLEQDYNWQWIAWSHRNLPGMTMGETSVTIDFNGNEIVNKGLEGYYGVNLWLRDWDQGIDLCNIEFTMDNYYYINQFGQPTVRFTDNSPLSNALSSDGQYLNVRVAINASETGTYYVKGDLHKVIQQAGGWDDWYWITCAETPITINEANLNTETEFNVSFYTAIIQSTGYDGPYTVHFDLMDSNWVKLDFIDYYQTASYSSSGFADVPANFTGDYNDYLYPFVSPEYLWVDVTVYVNESGSYEINGDLHKNVGWDWNFIAGSGVNQYFNTGTHDVTLQFDSVEILSNIEGLSQNLQDQFEAGDNFDIDVWLRRSGQGVEIDHLGTVASQNTYSTSNFTSSLAASIDSVSDNAYNVSGNNENSPLYDYLNITAVVNFTETGNYELWCDLGKDDGYTWHPIDRKNTYETITNSQLTGGYYLKNVTLQFDGERINSVGRDGPYNLHIELHDLDNGKRLDIYDDQTLIAYSASDFIGSSVEFVEGTASAVGVDSDDAGSEYDYLLVSVNVTAQSDYSNVEFMGDLHKESIQGNWQWISWMSNWTIFDAGTSTLTLRFDGEIISNSEINGPYQVRIELRDRNEDKMLDSIERLDTPSYISSNFQAASASFVPGGITDWGNDTAPADGSYDYLDINATINCTSAGTYEVMGDLFSDSSGWKWLGWTNRFVNLPVGETTVKLQFEGMQIRNKGINGYYKARLELRDSDGSMIDSVDPYTTQYSYNANDFQTSGAEFVSGSVDDRIIDGGDYLDLNVTVSCTTAGRYWIGADLHKESGWDWDFIAWESTEQTLQVGETNITILFSGQTIRNSGIDGPYHIRLELRDTDTWTEQDLIERHTTNTYYATNFSEPTVSFLEDSFTDWNNNTGNYLEINITINCTSAGTYWLNGDLQKKTGYNWQWIAWKGQDVTLTGDGEQVVKLQFDGEKINSSSIDGPYYLRAEIVNTTTWTMLDVVEEYTTNSYQYTDFEGSAIQFVDAYTADWGNDTDNDGDYDYLQFNLTVDCGTAGNYWLHTNIDKVSGVRWQSVTWQGQEITLTGAGEQDVIVQFDGSAIRNKGIDGPYQVRFELGSATGEFKQYDTIESYTTSWTTYSANDFNSAGVELVDMTNGDADSIVNGNLQINVTVNSSTTGKYEIFGDLFNESGWNWQWVTSKSMYIDVTDTGEQTFTLTFDGEAIYNSGINGYNARIELKNPGSNSIVDTIEKYITNSYTYDQFSTPSATINDSSDWKTSNNLQLNVSVYSETSQTYQINSYLHGSNWEFIAWDDNTTVIDGEEEVILQFDGSLINKSEVNPAKVKVELVRISDWKIVDTDNFALNNIYSYNDFNAGVTIGTVTSSVWDDTSDADDYNDTLNFTASITFSTPGTYKIFAGLKDQNGTWIAGSALSSSYSGSESINIAFSGIEIYMSGLNGPYTLSHIAILKDGKELAKATNVHTTAAYNSDIFEHPTGTKVQANFTGTYSSYVLNTTGDSKYEYLVVNLTVNVSVDGEYDIVGDLYTSNGKKWITADDNESLSLVNNSDNTVKLFFEGDDIYNSLTNGPYLLGLATIGANIESKWILLDKVDNAHTTASYSYSDFENGTVASWGAPVFAPTGITNVNVSNDPFSPNNDGSYDTTLVTVRATASQTLYLNIYNSSGVRKRTGLPLNEISSGTYTTNWDGKNDDELVVSDGTFTIKVTDETNGIQINESSEKASAVTVDKSPPTACSFEVKNGATYSNTTSVNLTSITATDNSSIKMRFKNSGANWTAWQDLKGTKSWVLSSTDGLKTVYYQAKDVANNTITSSVTDSITLDTTKPTVNMSITGQGDTPSTHTKNVTVTLSITGSDATSGVEYMKISKDITFSGSSWINYTTSKSWTLTSGDAVKTVYIKVKDRAGKESDTYSDNITLDTTSPTSLTISIDSGQTYTNSTDVALTLAATNASKMQISNLANFSGASWESYSTSKNTSLIDGNGTRTVYFRAKDTAGNIATSVNDTIVLDKADPELSSVNSSGVSQVSATITWTTDEASTSYVQYGTTTSYGSHTTLNSTKVMSHTQTVTGLNSGTTYHYRVKSRDAAGNEATSSDKTFTTSSGGDVTPPDAITGLVVSDKTNAEKTLSLSWNQSNAPDFGGYYIYRKANASFVNISASGVTRIKTITSRSTTTYDDNTSLDGYLYHYAVVAYDTSSNKNLTVTSVYGTSIDDRAPTTTDNFDPSWYTSEKTVVLTATDAGKGVNRTYYTTDGSDPSNSSNSNRSVYQISASGTGPFTVGEGNILGDNIYTIRYYSTDLNTTPNAEIVNNATLKVDTVAPSTTDDAPSGWQNFSVTVTLNANDYTSGVLNTYYTTDGSTPTVSSSTYSSPLVFSSDGNNTLKYFSKDNATNSETVKTSYIQIDGTKPVSSVNSLATSLPSPISISWTSSDSTSGINNVKIQYKNGTSGTWTNWLTGQNASGSDLFTDGVNGNTYYFRSIATDNASNEETDYDNDGDTYTTITGSLTVQISSPTDDYDAVSGDNWIRVKDNVTFVGTVNGTGLSIWYLNYSVDGLDWTNIANSSTAVIGGTLGYLNTTSDCSDGNYTVKLTALNISANSSVCITITVDNTAPNITVGPSSSVTSNSATITWTTNESANATVEYGTTSSYGSTKSGSSSTFELSHSETLTSLAASTTYHYRVVSYDKAKNTVNSSDGTFTTSAESSVGDDDDDDDDAAIVPVLTADAGGPYTGTAGTAIEFIGSATYGTSPYTYSWDYGDGSTGSGATTTHTYSTAGTYTVTLTVTDNAEATDDDTATVTISESPVEDTTAPTITNIKHTPASVTSKDMVTISATVTDDSGISSVNLYYNDGSDKTKSMALTRSNIYSATIGPFSGGLTVTYSLDATDVSSNSNTKQSSVSSFTVKAITVAVVGNVSSFETQEITSEELEETDYVYGVSFTTISDLANVVITIEDLDEKPESIPDPPASSDNIFGYLEISLTSNNETVEDNVLQSFGIEFTVLLSWLTDNNMDKEKVTLMRYHDGAWEELTTEYLEEDEIYAYYKATSTGTSTFAIVGGEIVGPPEEEPEEGLPWFIIIGAVVTGMILLIVFFFKAGYLYFEPKDKFKKKNKHR